MGDVSNVRHEAMRIGGEKVETADRIEVFNPYNACTTSILFPVSYPKSGPAVVQIYSLNLAVRYEFFMSQASADRSLSAASVSMILTLSRETTYEYVSVEGVLVLFPPATMQAFLLKFSPILTSNIIWQLICW